MAVYEVNNLTIKKGTTFNETFTISNEDGTPLDINNSYSAVAKIRKYPSDPTSYSFDVIIDEITSSINISMNEETTAQLPTGRCYFDILISYGYVDTTTKAVVQGTIIVQETASL